MAKLQKKSTSSETRNKAVAAALSQIRDKFGEGSIMTLAQNHSMEIGSIPT